jgi:hypothetical protein
MRHEKRTVAGAEIILRHDVDETRVTALAESLESGWSGRPVVLYADGDRLVNITGCHRIAAAARIDIDVPAMVLLADSPEDDDLIDFAAANDDHDAAHALRAWPEISALVRLG